MNYIEFCLLSGSAILLLFILMMVIIGKASKYYSDIEPAVMFSFLLVAALSIFYAVLFGILVNLIPMSKGTEVVETYDIISCRTDSEVSGSFFLGCGTIGEDSYYVTYYRTGDGGYQMMKFDVDLSTIYEVNDRAPCVEEVTSWMEGWWLGISIKTPRVRRFHIYVPEGTIIREFRIE